MKPHCSSCRIVTLLAVASSLFLAGCATKTYHVKVDAISKNESTSSSDAQSYKIKSKNAVLGDDNLRYKEAADFVKTALSGKGLYEAPTADTADMIV